jgi:hypothetical protein
MLTDEVETAKRPKKVQPEASAERVSNRKLDLAPLFALSRGKFRPQNCRRKNVSAGTAVSPDYRTGRLGWL